MNEFIGKRIFELENLTCRHGIAIFKLGYDDSENGEMIFEGYSIREFLRRYQKYKISIIEKCNVFYGEIVLRIRPVKE